MLFHVWGDDGHWVVWAKTHDEAKLAVLDAAFDELYGQPDLWTRKIADGQVVELRMQAIFHKPPKD